MREWPVVAKISRRWISSRILIAHAFGTTGGHEGQKFIFDPASKKFRSLLKAALQCELAKFGECLGLSSGEGATLDGALRALYAADDTQSLEIMARELNDSGIEPQVFFCVCKVVTQISVIIFS